MSDGVEALYNDLSEASKTLLGLSQPSLSITLDDIHRKALLLAAASYFESRLSDIVEQFCKEAVGESSPILKLVQSKAISRQYHTWFDWDSGNANKFFAMFGPDFKNHVINEIKNDDSLRQSIKQFISLGSDRNRLVHQNFGSFSLEANSEEILNRYKEALLFVNRVPTLLSSFTPS